MVGLTGIPFTNVFNACATAASAAKACADGIRLGDYDIGIAIGLDKHPRGAFTEDPALVGMPRWYAENGQYLTTKFFGMKANRYLHDHGISHAHPGQGGGQELPQRRAESERVPPQADRRGRDPQLADAELPADAVHVLRPDEGAAAVVMCRADIAHRYTAKPVYLRAVEVRTRRYGAYEVNTTFAPVSEDVAPTVYAARAAFEKAGVAPEDVDVIQLQDTDAGAEIIHMAECGFCADGDQERLLADGETEITGSMPVNTDGGLIANGEPIGASGLRQIHEMVRQLRGEAGDRQVPGDPRVGFAQLYGAPGHRRGDDPDAVDVLRRVEMALRGPAVPYRGDHGSFDVHRSGRRVGSCAGDRRRPGLRNGGGVGGLGRLGCHRCRPQRDPSHTTTPNAGRKSSAPAVRSTAPPSATAPSSDKGLGIRPVGIGGGLRSHRNTDQPGQDRQSGCLHAAAHRCRRLDPQRRRSTDRRCHQHDHPVVRDRRRRERHRGDPNGGAGGWLFGDGGSGWDSTEDGMARWERRRGGHVRQRRRWRRRRRGCDRRKRRGRRRDAGHRR